MTGAVYKRYMNLYMRAVGFGGMDSEQEAKFIKNGIEKCIKEGFILRHDKFKRGVIVLRVSRSTGIYVYGRYEGNLFIYEYHFPFLIGSKVTQNDEITIERHVDKESFAAICDEMKTGVTLIFYLQNVMDYMEFLVKDKNFQNQPFSPDKRNSVSKLPMKNKKTSLTALSLGGTILLPINKKNSYKDREAEESRRNLIAAAKNGDENAIESLTIEDIDTYTEISHRIMHEDVFTIVDSTFMPCGVECDQYSVIGEILDLSVEENSYTKEKIYIMSLECNNLVFTMAINSADLMGEPAVGRRFKGQIWLQGAIKF